MWTYLLVYLGVMSVVAVVVTVYDKLAAKANKRRVSEGGLLLLALFGGSVGMYLIMRLINHKTAKDKFMKGLPLMMVVQLLLGFMVYRMFNYFTYGG